ncbi:1,3-beta-glucanosyltransferase [Coniosporium apollinis]|uniref:1,3-beta-glucanosyltransferase n=2 Tax=Coniosporium TaxID=2810619 RepID=A0ABQ9NNP8_9PEZI|nr:1,3-beta-glucanosyltransferase [Cladosporium sp. JES 115]KAJ9662808.1 1,3-beta-glucanosyltransferase [Coniosporium apollinis]
MKAVAAFVAVSAALSASVSATPAKRQSSKTPAVEVRGNAFFANGKRFYIRGVDYQPGAASAQEDPLANPEACKRDIAKFTDLGINTIRVYTVDNTKNHDECMKALSDAGIYLALDVNSPNYSINRADPHPSYNDVYLQSVFATVDAFANYENLLLLYSANEVINDEKTPVCAPYVKAVTRDIRQYIRNRGYRSIPVGYSAADVDANRYEMATYMNCGTDDERSDFFAFNDYSWCNPSSYTTSGWNKKVEQYSNYSIPLFLSEYGCIKTDRTWDEVNALYSDDMTPVYSGGLVYEYTEEEAGYGIVQVNSDGTVEELDDYQPLKEKFAEVPIPSGDGGYKPNGGASECPAASANWDISPYTDNRLPAIPEGAKKYMTNGAGTGPGLQGGSQNAGTPSESTATAGSGQATTTASKGAAASLRVPDFNAAPLVCGLVALVSAAFGASLL